MRIGVYSDSLPQLDRRAMFKWCAERNLNDIEIGVGAWGPWPRPHLDIEKVGSQKERDIIAGEMKEFGIRFSAINAAGNLLHPDPAKRADAQGRFKAAVELAVYFKVDRVITMSGCPAGKGGGALSIFPCWATSADDERIFQWQMENEVGPWWRETSTWLARVAPKVMVCLEMHPGVTVFNSAAFEALTKYVDRNVGLNLDPSHFWWQGIDPVSVVEEWGDRIGHSHGKDTKLYPDRIKKHGVLHFAPPDPAKAPWHFVACGEGQDDATWVRYLRALRKAGYDGVISIEHEDPRYDGEEGTSRSAAGLGRALSQLAAAA